jgi:monoamine oxidase
MFEKKLGDITQEGVRFVLLEAQSELGGRVRTQRTEDVRYTNGVACIYVFPCTWDFAENYMINTKERTSLHRNVMLAEYMRSHVDDSNNNV